MNEFSYECVLCITMSVIPCELFCIGSTDSYCIWTFPHSAREYMDSVGLGFSKFLPYQFQSYYIISFR